MRTGRAHEAALDAGSRRDRGPTSSASPASCGCCRRISSRLRRPDDQHPPRPCCRSFPASTRTSAPSRPACASTAVRCISSPRRHGRGPDHRAGGHCRSCRTTRRTARRARARAEHRLYPQALRWCSTATCACRTARAVLSGRAEDAAASIVPKPDRRMRSTRDAARPSSARSAFGRAEDEKPPVPRSTSRSSRRDDGPFITDDGIARSERVAAADFSGSGFAS